MDNPTRSVPRPMPLVLGGAAPAAPGAARSRPIRTAGAAPARGAGRRLRRWAGIGLWLSASALCAFGAFVIRDSMFPALGRTEAPSAWQAPTRPPASLPRSTVEVPTGTTVASEPPVAATDAPPRGAAAVTSTAVHPGSTPAAGAGVAGPAGSMAGGSTTPTTVATVTDSSLPDTSVSAPTPSLPDDTLPDGGSGRSDDSRGPGSGGGADDSLP